MALVKSLRMDNVVADGTHAVTGTQIPHTVLLQTCFPDEDKTFLGLRRRQVELGCLVCAESDAGLSPVSSCAKM